MKTSSPSQGMQSAFASPTEQQVPLPPLPEDAAAQVSQPLRYAPHPFTPTPSCWAGLLVVHAPACQATDPGPYMQLLFSLQLDMMSFEQIHPEQLK